MASAFYDFSSRSYRNSYTNPNRRIPASFRSYDSGRQGNCFRPHRSRRSVSLDAYDDDDDYSSDRSSYDYRPRRNNYHSPFFNSEDDEHYAHDYRSRSRAASRDRFFTRNFRSRTDREPLYRTADSRHYSPYYDDDFRPRFRRHTPSYADVTAGRHRDHIERRGDDRSVYCSTDRHSTEPLDKARHDARPDDSRFAARSDDSRCTTPSDEVRRTACFNDRQHTARPDDRRHTARLDRRTQRPRHKRTNDRSDSSPDRRHADDPPREPAPDENFAQLIRIFYSIITIHHHLHNVSFSDGNKTPITIHRAVDHLCALIQPAMPNSFTMLALERNARQWSITAREILIQHYDKCLMGLMIQLYYKDLQNWRAPFKVAARWASRKFLRLKKSTIQRAEDYIHSDLEGLIPDPQEDDGEEDPFDPPPPPLHSPTAPTSAPPPPPSSQGPRPHRATATSKVEPSDPPPPPVQTALTSHPRPLKRRIKATCLSITPPFTGAPPHAGPHYQRPSRDFPSRASEKMLTSLLPSTGSKVTNSATQQTGSHPDSVDSAQSVPVSSFPFLPIVDLPDLTAPEPFPQKHRDLRLDIASAEDPNSLLSTQANTVEDIQFEHRTSSFEDSQEAEDMEYADASDDPRLLVTDSGDSPLLAHQPSSPPGGRVNVHPPAYHKLSDWTLTVHKKILLIGDSNVSRFPPFDVHDLQVECFPEATFRHIAEVLKKSTSHVQVESVILALGFYSRKQKVKVTSIKQFQSAQLSAFTCFQGARIITPLIHIPHNLPPLEKENLLNLNDFISDYSHFSLIDQRQFHFDGDLLWTEETARSIFSHWMQQLGSFIHSPLQ